VPFTVAGRNSLSNDVDFARVGLSYLFNFDNAVDWERSSSGTPGTVSGSKANAVSDFFADWQALVARARADQPNWATPLVTTTGLLLHRYRFDLAEQHIGNGGQTTVLDGEKALTSLSASALRFRWRCHHTTSATRRQARACSVVSRIGDFFA
jgi:hypothetical protein